MEVLVRKYKNKDLESLNVLLNKIYSCRRIGIQNENNIELVAIANNKVVGYLIINKIYDVLKDYLYGYINYVGVLEEYRNHGIATKLFEEVFKICEEERIKYLELTSNNSRVAAYHLYKKMGFVIRDTDVFRKDLI